MQARASLACVRTCLKWEAEEMKMSTMPSLSSKGSHGVHLKYTRGG